MTPITVFVNGETAAWPEGSTIADVVVQVTAEVEPKGIAVAVDREVIPRSEWGCTPVRGGTSIEVVTAAAGG